MKLNQKGAIDMTFVIILIVVAAVGYFVYTRITDTEDAVNETAVVSNLENSSEQNTSEPAEKESESTRSESWATLTSGQKGYSFSAPDGWSLTGASDSDTIFTNDLEYTDGQQAKLNLLSSSGSDNRYELFMTINNTAYEVEKEYTSESFEVGGNSGTKNSYTYPSDHTCEGLGCYYPGETAYIYNVTVDDKVFTLSYTVEEGGKDNIDTIEEMLGTLTFN